MSVKAHKASAVKDESVLQIWYTTPHGWCSGTQSYLTLGDPADSSLPGSPVHGFPKGEYWSELPFPSAGDLPTQRQTHISYIVGTSPVVWWLRRGPFVAVDLGSIPGQGARSHKLPEKQNKSSSYNLRSNQFLIVCLTSMKLEGKDAINSGNRLQDWSSCFHLVVSRRPWSPAKQTLSVLTAWQPDSETVTQETEQAGSHKTAYDCYGLNCVHPQIHTFKSYPSVPQNVTLSRDKVFTEVLTLNEIITCTHCYIWDR